MPSIPLVTISEPPATAPSVVPHEEVAEAVYLPPPPLTPPPPSPTHVTTRSESPLPQPLTEQQELESACPDVIELDQRLSVADLRRMTKAMLIEALRDAELPFRSNERKQVLLDRMIVHVSGPDE